MFDIPDKIACGEEHYHELLKNAELNRRFNGSAVNPLKTVSVVRTLLFSFANLLIRLGTWLKTVSAVIPQSATRDEATHKAIT